MDDLAKTVRAVARREVEPLLLRCRAINAEIDREESTLSEILNPQARAMARALIICKRAKLNAVVGALEGMEDRIMRLARERRRWEM
jgi:hypothetical protein